MGPFPARVMGHIKGQSQLHVIGAPAVSFRGQTLPYCSHVILASCLWVTWQFINMGRGTEFVMVALKTQKYEWCFQNHPEVDGGRVRPGGGKRDCGRSATSTGILYSEDAWQKASPGSTPSPTPGCGVHVKNGAPLLTPRKGAAWAGRGAPALHSHGRGGEIPHGGKPLCCSSSRLRPLLLQPGSTLSWPQTSCKERKVTEWLLRLRLSDTGHHLHLSVPRSGCQ